MNQKELIELINKDIDGELSPAEKELLKKEISNNKEAAKLNEDLRQTLQILNNDMDRPGTVDIEEEVIKKIMDKGTVGKRKSGIWNSFLLFDKNPWVIAFSMGVIAGIIVLSVFYSSGIIDAPGTGYSGTMSSIETYANFENADAVVVELNNIHGKISSQFSNDLVIASLDFSSEEKIQITLQFNERNFKLYSIKPVNVNAESNFASGRDNVLINNIGENKYLVMLKHNGNLSRSDVISIRLSSESGQTTEYSLLTSN